MTTSVTLSLDKRRPRADGTCAIVLRITHHTKVSQINTGFYIKETDWNEDMRSVKPNYKGTESVTRLNNQLQKKKAEAVDMLAKLDERKTLNGLTVVELKSLIEHKPQQSSFLKYGEKLIAELKQSNRIGNALAYKHAIVAVMKFAGTKDLSFAEINLNFLKKFEIHHLSKGKSYNGLSAYLRAVRAIYNQAIAEGTADKDLYPFDKYEIKSVKTRKRAITAAGIRSIEDEVLETGHPLYHVRNYFLVSFYLRGMSFVDLAHLKVENIVDGRIFYQRRKENVPYTMKIPDKVKAILELYSEGKERPDYLFPIVKRTTAADQYKDVAEARRRFNKKLKLLADLCGIQENLTSYVSRHSFATIAKNLNIPTASISDMLGHSDIKTTQVYLDSLPSDTLDDLHDQVVRKV